MAFLTEKPHYIGPPLRESKERIRICWHFDRSIVRIIDYERKQPVKFRVFDLFQAVLIRDCFVHNRKTSISQNVWMKNFLKSISAKIFFLVKCRFQLYLQTQEYFPVSNIFPSIFKYSWPLLLISCQEILREMVGLHTK